jgi:glycosyltransferase involved in cell wall biosynthesis
MDLSIVICTYNRATKLAAALEHLQSLTAPGDTSWEIVVVDNRSTDNTPAVIAAVAARTGLPIRYVYEGHPGSGAAHNAGISESTGEIIAFIDDDVFPAVDWLNTIVSEFRRDAELAGLGGRVALHNLLDYPVTIRTRTDRYQLSGTWDLMNGIPGCNMAFRRKALFAIGGFDPDFGAGATLPSAEDMELIFRALKHGLKLVYCPNVVASHDHGRRTQAQLDGLFKSYVVGRGAMYAKHILKLDKSMLRMAYWEMRGTIGAGLVDIGHLRLPRRSGVLTYFLFMGAVLFARTLATRGLGRLARRTALSFLVV